MEKRLFDFRWLRVLPLFAVLILFVFSVNGQTITGTVTDTNGEAVIGANVSEKGTTNGTITDMTGKYSINVTTSPTTLVFAALGYLQQEVAVSGQGVIDVQLQPEEKTFDEVVVVGYGTTKKKLVTGANLNVKGEDIQALNTSTAMDALKGITPGVNIVQNNAQPGAMNKINIRGIGTTGDSNPLFIVDGVSTGNIDYLSPSDIESIDVLKDAASAAIYGSRAANGVVLVTTKQGKKNLKPVITYDAYYGIQNIYKEPDLLNAKEYAFIMNEAVVNGGGAPIDYSTIVPRWSEIEAGTYEGTNWFKEMMVENAPIQNHSVNIQGGGERSTYSIGASFFDQDGVFGKQTNSFYKRFNLRLNSNHSLISKGNMDVVSLGQTLTYTKTKNNGVRQGNIYWNDVHNALVTSPFLPIYDTTGIYHKTIDGWNSSDPNPAALMEYNTKYNENDNNQIVGTVFIDIQPIKNLKLHSSFGVNTWFGASRGYTPKSDLGARYIVATDNNTQNMWYGASFNQENTLTYSLTLQGDHNISAMVGNSIEKSVASWNMNISNRANLYGDFAHAYISNTPTPSSENATNISIGGRNDAAWSMMSYFGRINYDFKETFLLNVNFRADASSNFLPENRWGYFPSVSVGYVMTNSSFMQGTSAFLDFLKIRASFGQVGNQNIGGFQYASTLAYRDGSDTYNTWSYPFGDSKTSRAVGTRPSRIPNPNIGWETSQQIDAGVDAYFLKSRLQVTFDWYQKDTKDWLVYTEIAGFNGIPGYTINGGSVSNKGIELAMNWNDKIGDITYGASVSFSHNKNEITEIANSEGIIHGPSNVLSQGTGEIFRAQVGYPIGYFYGYETDGILQNQAEVDAWVNSSGQKYFADAAPGDIRFVDRNGDGVINESDRTLIGDPNPDYVLGIQLHAEYKGISFSLTGNGAFGQQIAKSYRSFADSYKNNYTTDVFQRWHGEGTSNTYPRLLSSPHRNTQNLSKLFIQNGDYFKLSNITVGYDLKTVLKNMPLSEFRLYLTAKNLYTFTKYDGMDPEVGSSGGNQAWASGIDLGLYPTARTYMFGLSIKF